VILPKSDAVMFVWTAAQLIQFQRVQDVAPQLDPLLASDVESLAQ
jgi:hypothetical protein